MEELLEEIAKCSVEVRKLQKKYYKLPGSVLVDKEKQDALADSKFYEKRLDGLLEEYERKQVLLFGKEVFDGKAEMEKCKADPFYFWENYVLIDGVPAKEARPFVTREDFELMSNRWNNIDS